jgi:hypothetical protein
MLGGADKKSAMAPVSTTLTSASITMLFARVFQLPGQAARSPRPANRYFFLAGRVADLNLPRFRNRLSPTFCNR